MIKVSVGGFGGFRKDLFPETETIREVLEDYGLGSAGKVIVAKCGFLKEEDLDKPIKDFARNSELQLSAFPKASAEVLFKDKMFCDDDPPWDEEPETETVTEGQPESETVLAEHTEVVAPVESSADKAQEIREVISILTKETGKKAFHYMPLIFAALGIVELILFVSGSNMFVRTTYPLLILMFICSNMLWYCSNESKAKKDQAKPDQQQTEAGGAAV